MFYFFSQNNSGGGFHHETDRLSQSVIIEAPNPHVANATLESLGGYFDGVDSGCDCECCGDRWYRVSDYDGSDSPEYYGSSLADAEVWCWMGENPSLYVHMLDGTVFAFHVEDDRFVYKGDPNTIKATPSLNPSTVKELE